MKIKINGRSFIYPDFDIESFDSLGNIKYKLISKIVKSRPSNGDKLQPESYDNFNKIELKDRIVWIQKKDSKTSEYNLENDKNDKYEKNKRSILKNVFSERENHKKNTMVSIKSDGNWYEYPDDQIESWDADGNIKWSDKVHWKFTRNRPKNGDDFIYDDSKSFIKLNNNTINYSNIKFDYKKFNEIDRDSLIKIDDLTILIKSFMRPECVNNLLMSIRMRYDIKILIVDDSKDSLNFDYDKNIKTYNIEFDSGLSAGRNYGVSKIDTPYFLLCDDDFEFTEKTDLVKWLEILKKSDLDILGGDVIMNGRRIDYFGLLEKIDDKLYYKKGFHNETEFYKEYDLVLNFFIAKTKKIKKYKWDDSLKLAEHTAFFFDNKGKLKIGHTELFSINHQQVRDTDYSKFRDRAKNFFKEWMNKSNISEIINFKGEKMKK